MKRTILAALFTCLALACDRHHDHDHDGHHHHGEGGHAHKAPNGGVLVEFGDEACHLEFLRDDVNASRMILFAHKFHPQEIYLQLSMAQIEVVAKVGGGERVLVFTPVANATLGNNATHSSEYEAAADWLQDTPAFEARVARLTYPGGEEHNKTFQFTKED
jgi:hypothetical protein